VLPIRRADGAIRKLQYLSLQLHSRGETMNIRILLALCTLGLAGVTTAQEGNLSFKSTELAPGLFMLEGQGGFTGGNLALITGDDGVVLIDDGLEPLVALTLDAIESLTGDPVDFVINTHAHGDHTGANEALHDRGATVIGHENLRRRMQADEANRNALPQLTFNDSVTFHLNGHSARVSHVANAHTDGDSIIYFPEVNIIHSGDTVFNRLFPYIDTDGGGSVTGFIAAQKKILSMANDETQIIPGHGALASKADLQAALDMLEDAQSRVRAMVDAGKSLDEIQVENPLAKYHDVWSWEFITTKVMTETLYRSLAGSD
jgi:glyoxylase-like metal-dependent hydrolase (beta-lactamase superfamily II)